MSAEQGPGPATLELRQLLTSKEPSRISLELDQLAHEALGAKDKLLNDLGIAIDYEDLLADDQAWAASGKVAQITQKLSQGLQEASATPLSKNQLVTVNAKLAILAELQLLGRKDLSTSSQHKVEHPELRVGIQHEQMKAILAMEMMHSPEVPSGQGKSNPCVTTACVGRALLTGEQVHLMVANPQLKDRDGQRLAQFAQGLGLETAFIGEQESGLEDVKKLHNLVVAQMSLAYLEVPKEQRLKMRADIKQKIERLSTRITLRDAKAKRGELELKPVLKDGFIAKPALVVGTDSDFVFSKLKGAKWQASVIIDEETAFRRHTPYIVEDASEQTTDSFLGHWFLAGVTDKICDQLYKQDDLIYTTEDGQELFTEEGWDRWTNELQQALADQPTADAFDKQFLHSLEQQTATILQEVFGQGDFKVDAGKWAAAYLVELGKQNSIQDFDFLLTSWLQAKRVKKGVHYVAGDNIILRDEATGHPLEQHRFQAMTPFMIEAREKVCSLRPPSWQLDSRTGFHRFLETAYGGGKVAFTSATLDDLAKEIRSLVDSEVVTIDPWIGLPLKVPDFQLTEEREEALAQLRNILAEAKERQQPICLICDHDEELTQLTQEFRSEFPNLEVVLTRTSLDDEARIVSQAGTAGASLFANPREGRGIHIDTSSKSEAAGGLKLVVWGALESEAVLRQVLARTGRVGKKRDLHWLVYKNGGHCALSQEDAVVRSENLEQRLAELPAATHSLKQSVIENIFGANHEVDSNMWLKEYSQNKTAMVVRGMVKEELGKRLSLVRQQPEDYQNVVRRVARKVLRSSVPLERQPLCTDNYLNKALTELMNWPDFLSQIEENSRAIAIQYGLSDVTSFNRVVNEQVQRMRDFLAASWKDVVVIPQNPELPQKSEETIVGLQSMPNIVFNLVRETFASGRVQYRVGVMRFTQDGQQLKIDDRKDYVVGLPQGETELVNVPYGRLLLLKTIKALGGEIKFDPQDFYIELQALEQDWQRYSAKKQLPGKRPDKIRATREAHVLMSALDLTGRINDAVAVGQEQNGGKVLKAKFVRP
jgi:hypothetical protein